MPHIGKVIDSTVAAINTELAAMKEGQGPLGKVVVDVDGPARDKPAGSPIRIA